MKHYWDPDVRYFLSGLEYKAFDFLLKSVWRGGVAEDSDVVRFFQSDGNLIDSGDCLLTDTLVAEQRKRVEDKGSWEDEVGAEWDK